MIKNFCGKDTPSALASISWDTNFVFANGSKAPPWRQVYGDIGYVNVVPKDTPTFTILVLRKGYQIIKGYEKNANDDEVLNYEGEGDKKVFGSLIELIRTKSPHFTETIEKQKYKFIVEAVVLPNLPSKSNYASGVRSAGKAHESVSVKGATPRFEKNEPTKQANNNQKSPKKRAEPMIDPNSKWK